MWANKADETESNMKLYEKDWAAAHLHPESSRKLLNLDTYNWVWNTKA